MPALTKKYLCVVCGKGEIVESIVEHVMEGDVPDVSNCDFSTYSDHKVSNGKLLANRPRVGWKTLHFQSGRDLPVSDTPGGICTSCLDSNPAVWLLSRGGHINFVDEKSLKNSKR